MRAARDARRLTGSGDAPWPSTRHVIIAGAGIGGLTAALALARAGLRVTVLEQAPQLEETGAGIQLSPNATRVLIALGLARAAATADVVAPQAIRVMSGGRPAARSCAFRSAETPSSRYGAPYWIIHRGDLQAALAAAARSDAGHHAQARHAGSRISPRIANGVTRARPARPTTRRGAAASR